MAVKVMLATSLAKREDASGSKPSDGGAAAKPRRRRASVYDADGNEVFITLMCLKCHKMRPLSQFGLRKMADGAIRNQPWCRTCRTGASAESPKRRARLESVVEAPQPQPAQSEQIVDSGSLAAQVVAALHGGRR